MSLDFSQVASEKPQPKKKVVAIVPKLDIKKAQAQFSQYSQAIDTMVVKAQTLQVLDEFTNKEAVTMGTQAKKLYNTIEATRKEIIEEPNGFVKSINNFCKEFTLRLKDIETDLKKKISTFQYEQEMKRREAEKKAREESEKLQKKLEDEAKKKGIEAPVVVTPIVPKADKVTRTDEGGRSFQKMRWTFEVVDEAKVPREYCKVDPQAIRNAIQLGVREIPGLRIFEEAGTVFRTS